MRHSCTHISFAPAWGAIPDQATREKPKKYGANAPQLHPISYLSRTNPGKTKKYGANAPQLHAIRCSIDFCVMLCNEQAKKQKIRRKRATVAPYSMLYRFLCNAMQRDGVQPGPDLAFGLCCYVPGASIKLACTPRKRARSVTSACSPCCTWMASWSNGSTTTSR